MPQPDPTRLRIAPPAYRGRQWPFLGLVLLVAAFAPAAFGGDAYRDGLLAEALWTSVLAFGFFWCFSLAGQLTFAVYAMAAVGAYTSVYAANHLGGFWSGLLAAMLVTGALGALTFVVFGRLSPVYFAIASLAVAALVLLVVGRWVGLTGGYAGLGNIPVPSVFGFVLDSTHVRYYLMLGVLGVFLAATIAMQRSPVMRDLAVARDLSGPAATMGIRGRWLLVATFAVGSAMQGAGGSLYAHNSDYFSASAFSVNTSLDVLLMVLLGGMGSVYGPVIGAVLLVYLPELLRGAAAYSYPIYAALVILVVVAFPGGLAGIRPAVARRVRRRRAAAREVRSPAPST